MAVVTRKYNPGYLTDDDLVASFCVRTRELKLIVEILSECTGSSNPHQVVIGPRGSGKTSLLLRIAAELRRDSALSSRFFPIVFAEESYEVATAGEFWLECLSCLAAQAPRRESDPDLHGMVGELRTIRHDPTLGERCLGALQHFADREGKRLVLMVENLNMMLRDMADPDAGWRLRHTLQTEPRIVMLASATSRFDEIDNPKHALYDQFQVRMLRPLDTNECAVLWESMSGRCPVPETIRSLQILTGGSPRLLAIVARFGAGRSFRELMADLLDLVDDHTEYFKSHIESLPPQERRVYLALADLWKPATTREIADRSRLETSKCSAHLGRLIERGVVQVEGGTARRKQYYLTERLYNIYYLLRRSQGASGLVEALIQFMASYYSPSELRDFSTRVARDALSADPETQPLHRAALESLMALPELAGYREVLLAMIPLDLAEVLVGDSTPVDEAKSDDDQVDQHDEHSEEHPEMALAKVLLDEAIELDRQKRFNDALAAYDAVVRRYSGVGTSGFSEPVATALVNKGAILGRLNRPEEALAAFDEVVNQFVSAAGVGAAGEEAWAAFDEVLCRFGSSEMPILVGYVAMALVNRAAMLGQLGRREEALTACDEVARRFGQSGDPAFARWVAMAFVNKGMTLKALNRTEEALAAFDEVETRFGKSESSTLLDHVATALVEKGIALGSLDRPWEALSAFDTVVRQFKDSEDSDLLNQVAVALVNKGLILCGLNQLESARSAFDELTRRFAASETQVQLKLMLIALIASGFVLNALKRREEAIATWDEVVHQFDAGQTPDFVEQVARVFLSKAATLDILNRPEEALVTYEEVVRRFGMSETPGLVESVAMALANRGAILNFLNRPEEALAVYDEVIRRFEDTERPAILEQLVVALIGKGAALDELKRPDEALAIWDEVERRFGSSEYVAIRTLTEDALLAKAELGLSYRRYSVAIETAGHALDQRRTESLENCLTGHQIRAEATLATGDLSGCEQDVKAILAILPKVTPLPKTIFSTLMTCSIGLGLSRMRHLVKDSPSAKLLLPFTTALERELGIEPRVAREVEEVAQDIQRDLAKLREA